MTPTALVSSASLLTSWLAFATILSLVIALGAAAAQQLAARSVPARALWAGALLGALAVTLSQPLRRAAPVPAATLTVVPTTVATIEPVHEPSAIAQLVATLRAAPAAVLDGVTETVARTTAQLPTPVARALLLAWPLTSSAMLLVLLVSYRRHRTLLRRADHRVLRDVPVHITDTTGPVVIGALEPAIVLPRSLLSRSDDEQDLVVAHEQAHITARDPLLLMAGCIAVVLMPWNVAAWYMLARLRLAIELDCDARVLARGASTRRYGQLLIELSADTPAPVVPLGAPAFSFRASHLERRLRTMTARPARFLAARRVSALVVSAAALLAACGAELPTAAEVQAMDVATAERTVFRAVPDDSASTRYVVNGVKVDASLARGIAADSIATINILRKKPGSVQEIRIDTKDVATRKPVKGTLLRERPISDSIRLFSGNDTALIRGTPKGALAADPLLIINGVVSTKVEMEKLAPSSIENVEVVKGASATALYGAKGANGVIVITTKK